MDIQKPDYELRKIVKKVEELSQLYPDQVKISKELEEFISTEISASIRELVAPLIE